MSRINHLLTCSVLAVAVTGCQSARTVTNNVIHWRPFGGEKIASTDQVEDGEVAKNELAEAEPAKPAAPKAEAADKVAPEVQAAILTAQRGEKEKTVEPVSAAVPADSAPEAVVEKQPQATEDSFHDFMKAMESQQQLTSQPEAAPTAQPAVENAQAVAKAETKTVENNATENKAKAPGTDQLTQQVEELLAEYRPVGELVVEETKKEPQAQQPEIQQAALTEQKDPALVAYDLASFADASVKEDVAKTVESETVQQPAEKPASMSFESWVQQNSSASVAEAQQVAVTTAAAAPVADFPWAAFSQPSKNTATVKTVETVKAVEAAKTVETVSQEEVAPWAEKKPLVAKTVKPMPAVSADVLKVLEEALGHEDWRNAERAAVQVNVASAGQELKITEMLQHDNYQIRLRGIRLAYEQQNPDGALLDSVARLLDDKHPSVRAHAASTLYHCKRQDAKIVETLSNITASGDNPPAHLAAMFLGDMVEMKEQVVPVLKTALLSTSGLTRMYVAESLLRHDPKNVDAVASLTELMRHENVEVRWLTAHALGSVRGELQPYAVEALRGGLRDIDPQVRATSALSLGGLGRASRVAVAELTFISAHAEDKVKDAAIIALECIQQ